jgi:hypothetical protein
MTAPDSRIERFLGAIKAEGRSSPTGMYWHEFYEFLQTKTRSGKKKSHPPLILAASGESDSTKHGRLHDQLEWALDNECVDEAIHYLKELSADCWNSGSSEGWNADSY